ncbi:hypothetical protein ACHAXR_012029 [Thalassiosira sp. AJA248-18]
MPPRADLDSYAADALTIATFALSSKPNPTPKSSLRNRRRPRIPFRNIHGISGLVSTFLTCLAIATQQMVQSSHWLRLFASAIPVLAAIASTVTAASGMTIVDQAPKQTVVMEYPIKVIPPHRDAFRRTAFSVFYLCARICWNTTKMYRLLGYSTTSGNENDDVLDWLWGCVALCYAMNYFIPRARDVDWFNGNTYVFVVPMALGLTADAFFQLPILQCNGNACWNEDAITQFDLLWVILSGLVVAFVFTLAFRGVLDIRNCYWSAALVVHGVVAYLIVKAIPFLGMQIIMSS